MIMLMDTTTATATAMTTAMTISIIMVTDMTPGQAQILLQQAQAYQHTGRVHEALATCRSVLKRRPRDFGANYLTAMLHAQQGELTKAIGFFRLAAEIDPGFVDARYNLAYALNLAGKHQEAAGHYEVVLRNAPHHLNAQLNYANTLNTLGRHADAVASYDKIISSIPNSAPAYVNRGTALKELRRLKEAVADYDKAVALAPDYAEAYSNRGIALHELRRFDEALENYQKAIKLKPRYVEANINRGITLHQLKRFDAALESYDAALAIAPDDSYAIFSRSLTNLLRGNFDLGWREYEWRKNNADYVSSRSCQEPLWLGAAEIAGKRILVHFEQGLGDTIQFCRYVRLLQRRGADVLFAPQAALKALMRSLGDDIKLVDVDDQSLRFDYHCPLLSLPLAFKTDRDSIPGDAPYLVADPERRKFWCKKIGDRSFKIGICWQSAPSKIDRGRSFGVEEFFGISQMEGVRLINLHKGEGEAQLSRLPAGMKVEKLEEFDAGPDAFLDTAAVMESLDLVITCDTAIAHLAGALGRPTWVALQYVPDWRWLLDRNDSPWYPTIRLFRQQSLGDWEGVFSEIQLALTERMQSAIRAKE